MEKKIFYLECAHKALWVWLKTRAYFADTDVALRCTHAFGGIRIECTDDQLGGLFLFLITEYAGYQTPLTIEAFDESGTTVNIVEL